MISNFNIKDEKFNSQCCRGETLVHNSLWLVLQIGRYGRNFECLSLKSMCWIDILSSFSILVSCECRLMISEHGFIYWHGDVRQLVFFPNRCWHTSVLPYDATRPQWVHKTYQLATSRDVCSVFDLRALELALKYKCWVDIECVNIDGI